MVVGVVVLEMEVVGCNSLKEKRSRLKPFLARLHQQFNISTAEVERQDAWRQAVVACALVSNDAAFTQKALQQVVDWVESNWPDLQLISQRFELR